MRASAPPRTTVAAFALAAVAGCGQATATRQDPALGRQIGVLQMVNSEATGADTSGGRSDSAVSSGPITWDRPPGPDVVTPLRVIELPDTVLVGQQVDVIVRTVLPDGCWRTDGESVRQSGLVVEVTPQDVRSDAQICPMIWSNGVHEFRVTFASRGTATVRVNGRLLRQGSQTTSEPVWAERSIVVR
ncbi:MAG: hypothetical protein ACJ79S_06870 [Gemmatimonadaceae bacterium]